MSKAKLTNEQLVALIQSGKKQFETLLVKQNMGLVRSVAHKFQFPGVEFEDRVQDGCIGLLAAIKGYDENKGMFSTHATKWIRAYIIREGNEQANMIHVPGNVLVDKVKIIKYCKECVAYHGYNPSVDEIGAVLGIKVEHVKEIMSTQQAGAPDSLDKTIEGGEGETMQVADVVGGKTLESGFDDRIEAIKSFVDELPATEQFIVTRVLGLDGKDCESYRQLDYKVIDVNGNPIPFTTINRAYLNAIEYIKARIDGRAVVFKPVNKPTAKRKNASKRDIVVAMSDSLGTAFVTSDIKVSQEQEADLPGLMRTIPGAFNILAQDDVVVFCYMQGVKLTELDATLAQAHEQVAEMEYSLVVEA